MMPRNASLSEVCTPNRCRICLRDDRQTVVVLSSTNSVKRNSVEPGLDFLMSVIFEKKVHNSGFVGYNASNEVRSRE